MWVLTSFALPGQFSFRNCRVSCHTSTAALYISRNSGDASMATVSKRTPCRHSTQHTTAHNHGSERMQCQEHKRCVNNHSLKALTLHRQAAVVTTPAAQHNCQDSMLASGEHRCLASVIGHKEIQLDICTATASKPHSPATCQSTHDSHHPAECPFDGCACSPQPAPAASPSIARLGQSLFPCPSKQSAPMLLPSS